MSGWEWRRPPAALVALAAMLVALAINHAGYRGGGADDWQYLEAARCAVAQHGLCVPTSHWWARFPLVAPLALALALGGESRLTLGLVPLLYAAAAIILFTLLVERWFGRAAAMLGGVLIATLPAISLVLLQPNVDTAELAFMLAALLAFDSAARGGRGAAIAGGALLGLAILTRPSALALLPILALAAAATPQLRRLVLPAALGLAATLAAEAIGLLALARRSAAQLGAVARPCRDSERGAAARLPQRARAAVQPRLYRRLAPGHGDPGALDGRSDPQPARQPRHGAVADRGPAPARAAAAGAARGAGAASCSGCSAARSSGSARSPMASRSIPSRACSSPSPPRRL